MPAGPGRVCVTMLVPPSVAVAPVAVFPNRCSKVVFTVQRQGTPPPMPRWFFTPVGGAPTLLTGENSATWQRTAVNDPHAGTYTVQASNSVGIAFASAVLVVGDAPQFLLQPASRWAKLGSNVTMWIVPGGNGGRADQATHLGKTGSWGKHPISRNHCLSYRGNVCQLKHSSSSSYCWYCSAAAAAGTTTEGANKSSRLFWVE